MQAFRTHLFNIQIEDFCIILKKSNNNEDIQNNIINYLIKYDNNLKLYSLIINDISINYKKYSNLFFALLVYYFNEHNYLKINSEYTSKYNIINNVNNIIISDETKKKIITFLCNNYHSYIKILKNIINYVINKRNIII